MRWHHSIIAMLTSLASLVGCSSVSTHIETASDQIGDGIVYYVPTKPLKLTVTVGDTINIRTPTVATADALPDYEHRFVLYYDQNYVGQNHMTMSVDSKGLLKSLKSETVSGVSDIVQNLAKAAGDITAMRSIQVTQPRAPTCESKMTYYMLINVTDPRWQQKPIELCQFAFNLRPLWPRPVDGKPHDNPRLRELNAGHSGIFYRQDLPYVVTVSDLSKEESSRNSTDFLVLAPDESPIMFVPITRTLFSNNVATLTVTDGIVTGVEQSADGELVALSKLPAAAIEGYFQAIGGMFSQLATNATNEKNLISAQESLALQQIKYRACVAAIALNPVEGKSDDERKKAFQNIQAACS